MGITFTVIQHTLNFLALTSTRLDRWYTPKRNNLQWTIKIIRNFVFKEHISDHSAVRKTPKVVPLKHRQKKLHVIESGPDAEYLIAPTLKAELRKVPDKERD